METAVLKHTIDIVTDGKLYNSVLIYSDGSYKVTNSYPKLYRMLHDIELGPLTRWGVPEVFRLFNETSSMPLTREWQLLIKAMNPTMSNAMWRRLLDWQRAFTNGSAGYDFVPDKETGEVIPLQDWVNLRDLDVEGVPRFEIPRICGGAVITGTVIGDNLWVDTLDGTKSPPKPEDIPITKKFICLNVKSETVLTKFPQGEGADVWMPLVTTCPVSIPLKNLQLWTSTELPNPYSIYSIKA